MDNLAVIFDMDGVIANTNPFHSKAFEAFFDKHHITYSLSDFEQHMYGKHNSYIMSHFFNRKIEGKELHELEHEKEGLFRKIYLDHIEAISHFCPFLMELNRNHILTGVATSAPKENMDLIIDGLDIRRYMSSLLSSEDVSKHKPDPEIYIKTAQRLGVKPENCVVFEDSFSGITAAKNAGMKVVAVLSSHTPEELPVSDMYIKDYQEVNVDIIRKLISNP